MEYTLTQKFENLKEKVLSTSLPEKEEYIVFFSASNGKQRANVVNAKGKTIESAFENALRKIKQSAWILGSSVWLKVDVVTEARKYDYQDFLNYVTGIKRNYFREGISFDANFELAFLEQEVNANNFIQGLKDENPQAKLSFENINYYLKTHRKSKKKIKESSVNTITVFKTIGFFHDNTGCYELGSEWLNNGCRRIEYLDKDLLYDIVDKSSQFLTQQVYENGKFRYGYFPAFNKEINTYNILRHASTTYSMVEAYELTRNEDLLKAIERSFEYLVTSSIMIFDMDGEKRAFVVDEANGNEIKLGSNAHALLAMCKYTTVCGKIKYLDIMNLLAEGIAYFQDLKYGSFVHVLNYPNLTIKDKFRTIYYDGEAVFALMRFYDLTENERWLNIVEKSFEYFINHDYWKYGDHWLSYASNELFRHRPNREYAELNLKNANRRLDFSLTRETAYPTLLELLMASYRLIQYMRNRNLYLDLLESFDEEKLMKAINHRARHQLNSYFWPEMAMYFKVPNNILNSFYIRHHAYRVRIDDIEHNISGYCSLIKELASWKEN